MYEREIRPEAKGDDVGNEGVNARGTKAVDRDPSADGKAA
jgi:hypothetical protein